MAGRTSIKSGLRLSPKVLLIAAGLTAVAFGIYLYFTHAATADCSSGVVLLTSGDSCSVQAPADYMFGYRSIGASSYSISYNNAVVSSSDGVSPTSGCWSGGPGMVAGTYTFTVKSGSIYVHGGNCDTTVVTPTGRLSCAVISPVAIRWTMHWQNSKSEVVLMRSGKVIHVAGGAPKGADTYTEQGLFPRATYAASLRDGRGGAVLASASCRL